MKHLFAKKTGIVLLITACASIVFAEPVRTAHAVVELVSDAQTIVPGETFRAGVRVRMDPEWHIYWINPGEAGSETRVTWRLPPGFKAGELQWPYPRRFVSDGIVGFGYEGEVILFAEITPPLSLSYGSSLQLEADVEMLLCREICVPGFARPELSVEVGKERVVDADGTAAIDKAAAGVPVPVSEEEVTARFADGNILVSLSSAGRGAPIFFPETRNLIAVEKDPVWIEREGRLEGQFPLSHLARGTPFRFRGVLVWRDGKPHAASQVDVRLRR